MQKSRKNNRTIGKQHEELAANWLIQQGYKILKKNYQAGRNEIDLIALKEDEIIFVEVKYRILKNDYDIDLAHQALGKKTTKHHLCCKALFDDFSTTFECFFQI